MSNRIEKIRKRLKLGKTVTIANIGNMFGFELYQFRIGEDDFNSGEDTRLIYVTDSNYKNATECNKHQISFLDVLAKDLYKV